VFDVINVALSIAFGLNIASSLKEIALDFRWWILSYRRRPTQEVRILCRFLELLIVNGFIDSSRLNSFCVAIA
jgi:hypothetical protein